MHNETRSHHLHAAAGELVLRRELDDARAELRSLETTYPLTGAYTNYLDRETRHLRAVIYRLEQRLGLVKEQQVAFWKAPGLKDGGSFDKVVYLRESSTTPPSQGRIRRLVGQGTRSIRPPPAAS